MTVQPTWTVAQIGARENYAAARAFAAVGRLHRLYTDAWCRFGNKLLLRGPAFARALAGRTHPDLPISRVVSFTPSAVLGEIRGRRRAHRTSTTLYDEYLRIGRWFDGRVAGHLSRHPLPPGPNAFFTYNTGCLETVKLLRGRGVVTLVDQIDPARVEYEIVQAEVEKWPGWVDECPVAIPDAYFERLAAEWAAADAVVVNSAWSADALAQQGVSPEKIHVVPLAYDPPSIPDRSTRTSGGPVIVLWLGNVVLRKGIQYLVEAAKLLAGRPIRFVVAGPIGISQKVVAAAPDNMQFVGRLTRDRTGEVYRSADLFVLPTLSDGFAITQLEAMAHGLPVIATPCCGAVVDHGADGLIVPAGDVAALARAIAELAADPDRRAEMGRRARQKAGTFTLAAVAERLDAVAALGRN